MKFLGASWEAPPSVKAFSTTRTGGTSEPPYASLNLGIHVGDQVDRVLANRALVRDALGWAAEPFWLDQVHGTRVVRVDASGADPRGADGAVTEVPGQPLVVLTADCLPVVACDRGATVVGAFHAGWRGLLAGILREGVAALGRPAPDLLFWIGPAIGPRSYQVGPEVREAYLAADPAYAGDFSPDGVGHWKFDLPGAALRQVRALGVGSVVQSRWDTFADPNFFSFRREGPCGRLGTFIALEKRGIS